MVIVYHFANPDIEKIILLGAFIILIIGGIQLKIKRDYIKFSILFILSGLITTLWYTIFFFIPAFMFTTPPTPTEIQFADNYIFIWHNLVPNIILISSFGIINIIIGQFNRNTYGLYLMTSGIVFCIS
ncbi:MAG: hypothetical protein ACFFKA_03890, partial [Candidatus Thorarchaeota archaeon]